MSETAAPTLLPPEAPPGSQADLAYQNLPPDQRPPFEQFLNPPAPGEAPAPPVPDTVPPAPNPTLPPLIPGQHTNVEPSAQPTPPAEQSPLSDDDQRLRDGLTLRIGDLSQGVEAYAADAGAERLNRLTTEGNFAQRFVRKIWHGNIARDFTYLNAKDKARSRILEDRNIHAAQGGTAAEHDESAGAIIERMSNDFMHGDESQERLARIAEGARLEAGLKQLIKDYASGTIQRDALIEEKNRLLDAFGKSVQDGGDRRKGQLFADNVLEVATNARAAHDHDGGIDRVDAALNASSAGFMEAHVGVRTQAKLNRVERIADKIASHRYGMFMNETAILAVASIPLAAGKFVTNKVAVATGAVLTMGTGAAVVAGVRESLHIEQDKALHAREMAEGGGDRLVHAGKRREKIETARYETVPAADLMADLDAAIAGANNGSNGLHNILDVVTRVETRINKSFADDIDLIQFSGKTAVEKQRLELDIKLAAAKVASRHALGSVTDAELSGAGATSRDMDALITERTAVVTEAITREMSAKDRIFNKIKRNSIIAKAGVAFIAGETIGHFIQEAKALLDDKLEGIFEHITDAVQRQTYLKAVFHDVAKLWHHNDSNHNAAQNAPVTVNHHASVDVPVGYHLAKHEGNWELFDAHNNVVDDNVTFDVGGHFSHATNELLTSKGFHIGEHLQTIGKEIPTGHRQLKPEDYLRTHKDQFTHVHRTLWYDNDTSAPKFDHNELRLWPGGINNSGFDKDGNIVYTIQHMTADGSYHDGVTANALQLIHEHKIDLGVAMDRNTQAHEAMFHFNEHGVVTIDKHSAIGQLYSNDHGHMVFHGGYAEAEQLGGVHNGVQNVRVLATQVGLNNIRHITETIPGTHAHQHVETILTAPAPAQHELPIEIPPILPIYGRTGLEYPLEKRHRPNDSLYNSYGYGGPEEGEDWEKAVNDSVKERSPRLIANPEAALNPAEELTWYREELKKRRGVDGLSKLEAAIDQSPELRQMSPDVETIVTVPVAAIQEANTLYDTLSLYGRQSKESLDKSIILLNLNYLDTAAAQPNGQRDIEKARQAIEKARQDFPDLRVAVIENEYKRQAVEATGGVIGYVAADLADAAMLAVQKRMQAGAMSPDHDVLIIRNDADPEGLSRHYLEMYQKALNNPKNKDIDVLKGITRFGAQWAEKYPGFVVASNFAAALSLQLSSRGLPATGGANFGIKASTLAAIGGLGEMTRTGAGSDDGALGRRIRLARWGVGVFPRGSLDQTSVLANGRTVPYRAMAAHVGGATVDTNPARLVPYYIEGQSYSNAWGSDFSSGEGGYRSRLSGVVVTPNGRSEIANDWDTQFEGIEDTITSEMRWNGEEDVRRALSVFFGHVPGSYALTGTIGTPDVEFKLTSVGKQYLRRRFEQENYGANQRQRLYDDRGTGKAPLLSATPRP